MLRSKSEVLLLEANTFLEISCRKRTDHIITMYLQIVYRLCVLDAIERGQVLFVKSKCNADEEMERIFDSLAQKEDAGKTWQTI